MPKPTTKKNGKVPETAPEKKVLYPDLVVNGVKIPREKCRITAAMMKDILGWEEVPDGAGKDTDFDLKDAHGKRIRLTNNSRNRRFDPKISRGYTQDVLHGNYAPDGPNGETMIVGRYGAPISLQHRGAGLVLAVQKWEMDPEAYPFWKEEPYIESLIVFGVSEDPRSIQTTDNVRPRDFADVLYTDPTLFSDVKANVRDALTKETMHAVRTVWYRTGRSDAMHPNLTNSEGAEFLRRHLKLAACVKHVHEENAARSEGEGKDKVTFRPIGRFFPPGTAAGMMYLMAASGSDGEKYHDGDPPSEDLCDFGNLDKAEEFWTLLAGSPDFDPVRDALRSLVSIDGDPAPLDQKTAVIVRAWRTFVAGEPLTPESLSLDDCSEEVDGVRVLTSTPTVDGIDRGEPEEEEVPTESPTPSTNGSAQPAPDPEPEKETGSAASDRVMAFNRIKEEHPGTVLIFNGKTKTGHKEHAAFGGDAKAVAEVFKMKVEKGPGGLNQFKFPPSDLDTVLKALAKDRRRVAAVDRLTGGEHRVTVLSAASPSAPAPEANGAAPKKGKGKKAKAEVVENAAPEENPDNVPVDF